MIKLLKKHSKTLKIITISSLLITLIVLLPPIFTDILLISNIFLSIILPFISCYSTKLPIYSSPHFFLFHIYFNLIINLGTTLLILFGQGEKLITINYLSNLFMEGNPILSLILLFVIQALLYFSLMKGAKKVTEITARFTLDAIPIKDIAIDTDLNAGAISFDESKKRRTILTQESDFYQALDRVCEFLNRYFIVYIILTLINLLGGIIIEVYLKNGSLYNAFSIYSTYAVGDSLCFIIPNLIVTIAILVVATKSDRQNALYYGYEI